MKKILAFLIITFCFSQLCGGQELSPGDIATIKNIINDYEIAYQDKNLENMVKYVDKSSPWYSGLEKNMSEEFERYKYIRLYSGEGTIEKSPDKDKDAEYYLKKRTIYVAFYDMKKEGVNDPNAGSDINEYEAVYILDKAGKKNRWKIKAFGQILVPEHRERLEGIVALRSGKINEAISKFKRSLTYNPGYSASYSSLSDISLAMGKIDEAAKYAENAVKLQPDIPYYHFSSGMIYLFAKQQNKALEEFKKTRELDKKFPDIDYYITNIDKIAQGADSILKNHTINDKIAELMALNRKIAGDELMIGDLNIKIAKPRGWYFIPIGDWHSLAVMSSKKMPDVAGPIITVNMRPAQGLKPEDLNAMISKKLAASFNNKQAIRMGETETNKVAGLQALEDLYVFVIEGEQVVFLMTSFIKNDIAYTIVYSSAHKMYTKENFNIYKETLSKFNFIDPKKDISNELKKMIFEAQALQDERAGNK